MSWNYVKSGTVGPVLVCLHGVGGNASAFAPQLSGLSDAVQVWSIDIAGYGKTAPLLVMDWDHLVTGLKQFLDHHKLHNVYLLGHSFGGMLAQAFAAKYADDLAGLILYSTSAAFGSNDGEFQKQFIEARLKPLNQGCSMAQLAAKLIDPLLAQPSQPQVRKVAIEHMAQVPNNTYRQAMQCISLFDCRDNLPHLKLPTLLLAGAVDQMASPLMMQRLASKIEDSKLCILPNAGHLANLEQAHLFNQQVSNFIALSTNIEKHTHTSHKKGALHAT